MCATIKYIVLGVVTSGLFLLSAVDAASPAAPKKKQQESPALRACFDGCKVHKTEKAYETCMNQCVETHKDQQGSVFKK